MSIQTDLLLAQVRQPEYTGENRCVPCTVVNVGLALGVTAIVAVFAAWLAPVVFGISLTVIYLRGYLVPGTPELTKQYLPDQVLRWFDKVPSQTDAAMVGATEEGREIDPEPALLEAGILKFTTDGSDLQLTDEFRTEWRERIEAVHEGEYESRLGRMLGDEGEVDPDAIEVRIDDHSVTVFLDDTPVAMWTSEAALVADLAAAPLLQDRVSEWRHGDLGVRGQLLHGVRVFLERCPTCGGDLALSEETRESCCRTAEVATLTCNDCGGRLLEVEI